VKSEISRGLFSICSCLLAALPFEYVDEHEDFNYDLDTAQSQAKYDVDNLTIAAGGIISVWSYVLSELLPRGKSISTASEVNKIILFTYIHSRWQIYRN